MKQKQLSILAASLVAAFAVNAAHAGQIQSSSSAIAHEVIVNDAQAVAAPPVSYRFAGDIDASLVEQTFQVQLVLDNGTFANAGTNTAITLVNNAGVPIAPADYTVSAPQLSADKKTLYANVTFPQGAGKIYVTPAVRFNDTLTNVGAAAATVNGLYTVVGPVAACVNTVPTLGATVKHFANVTSLAMATDVLNANPANEHQRAGSTNNGTLFTFPTNIELAFKAANSNLAAVDPALGNTFFKGTVAASALPATVTGFKSNVLANLGSFNARQAANGSDSGANTQYLLANGVTYGAAAATNTTGVVELATAGVQVVIETNNGFAVGSQLLLSTTPDVYTPTATANASPAYVATVGNTITLNATLTNAELANPVYVFYQVPGTSVIPTSTFKATVTLKKAPGTSPTFLNEQDNSCNAPLASLAGGVKIDVRNYSTSANNSGWTSVIRLINPSEVNTATVYGQLIHADGSYGGWGKIATLAPRASKNMASTEIDPLLTGTPVNNGAGYVGGAVAPAASGLGDRLRITADGVSSLRVQNYLYNHQSNLMTEASGSQAVDFEGTIDRAPVNEGQYQSQDAQRGLAK